MEYVYSVEPLRAAYLYTGLSSMVPVLIVGILGAAIAGCVAGMMALKARSAYLSVLAAFCVYPMYWSYKAQATEPLPNIPVVGTIDSYSESTEMVRINKHRTEPQWRGYVIYRVDDVLYPVRIVGGRPMPERALFYKNPRHLAPQP